MYNIDRLLHDIKTKYSKNFLYPSETKNSPLLATATSVGLQKCELSLPGVNASPKVSSNSCAGLNLKTYKEEMRV